MDIDGEAHETAWECALSVPFEENRNLKLVCTDTALFGVIVGPGLGYVDESVLLSVSTDTRWIGLYFAKTSALRLGLIRAEGAAYSQDTRIPISRDLIRAKSSQNFWQTGSADIVEFALPWSLLQLGQDHEGQIEVFARRLVPTPGRFAARMPKPTPAKHEDN